MVSYDYWPAVVSNFWKVWKMWSWLTRVLVPEGKNTRVLGKFSKAVVQTILLFGLETLVMTPPWSRSRWGSIVGWIDI